MDASVTQHSTQSVTIPRAHIVTCDWPQKAQRSQYPRYQPETLQEEQHNQLYPYTPQQPQERASECLHKCEQQHKCTSTNVGLEQESARIPERNPEAQHAARQNMRQAMCRTEYITVWMTASAPPVVHDNAKFVSQSNNYTLTFTKRRTTGRPGPEPPQSQPSQHIHFEQPVQPLAL